MAMNPAWKLALLLLLVSSSRPGAQAADVFYEWDLEAILQNDLSPDCMNIQTERRSLFLVNEEEKGAQFPGPLIEANEGDTIHVSSFSIQYSHLVSYQCPNLN